MDIPPLAPLNAVTHLLAIDASATTVLVIILIIFIFISFIISGAEVAFFSLTFKDINYLKTKQNDAHKRILDLLEDPKGLLASMLIANTFSNIAIIIISNILLDGLFQLQQRPDFWIEFLVKVLAVTAILVLFCEVIPKIYANHNNIRFAKESSLFIEGFNLLFKGMGRGLVRYTDIIERKLSSKLKGGYNIDQLHEAIELTNNTPASEKEKNILKGILKFGNTTVKQVMKTRMDVSGLDYETSFPDLIKKIEELHYSRLPVYKENLDEVIGIIHTKDILPHLHETTEFNWHELMRPAYFVHEQKFIEDLLQEFQNKRIHFAVVVDEFGGTSGIITLEDIMEEVIGDIRDEFDEEDISFKKIDETTYIFEGRTMIYDAMRVMDLPAETFDSLKGESDSLAGLVLEIAGAIPPINEAIQTGDFEFTIIEINRNRLEKIKISYSKKEE